MAFGTHISEVCSGLTQHQEKQLCFSLVLSSCHLLSGQDCPANHSLHEPHASEQYLSTGIPRESTLTHTYAGALSKASLKDVTQMISDVHEPLAKPGRTQAFSRCCDLNCDIRAFQDVTLKLRYDLSQFCSELSLQLSRAPVNVSPKHAFWGTCIS